MNLIAPPPPRHPEIPADIILLSVAATRFGYAEAPYFRKQVAPSLGLAFFKARNRWYTTRQELEAAVQRQLSTAGEGAP